MRPDERKLHRLPTLEAKKATFEKCVFCPKLCRSACPVSNAEPRETLTPWGKMSMAYFVANGSVATAKEFAAPAWACTGCFGCREQCDHRNDVTGSLYAARSALASTGMAPPAARRVLARFSEVSAALAGLTGRLGSLDEVRENAENTVLIGCAYARHAENEAADAVRVAARLSRGHVSLTSTCCGAPLLHAGDEMRFREQGERFRKAVAKSKKVLVVDAGCAATIRIHLANAGVPMDVPVEHLVEAAGRELARLEKVNTDVFGPSPLRWHDPCHLGRGLGLYEEPRAILERAIGEAPAEFDRARSEARCSGAGGLLPATMPDVAAGIATTRASEHTSLGGGTIVTACASSLRSFRKRGVPAVDLATVLAYALGAEPGKQS